MINAIEILQEQLSRSLGLDRYTEILYGDPTAEAFQHTFNGYYRIRRNETWQTYTIDCSNKQRPVTLDLSKSLI